MAAAALERGVSERLMECVRSPECDDELRGLCVMVLANVTITPAGAARLLQEGRGPLEGATAAAVLNCLA
jgi:hypothetical protein